MKPEFQALDVNPHCYFFSASIRRNYQGNIFFCGAERAQPLHIDRPDEQEWITSKTKNLVGIDRLWTGGNQENPTLGKKAFSEVMTTA